MNKKSIETSKKYLKSCHRLNIRMDDYEFTALNILASHYKTSKSEVIRMLIKENFYKITGKM